MKIFITILAAILLNQCGYKAQPSPYFDEKDRFSDEIYRREENRKFEEQNYVPSVILPSPSPSSKKQEEGEQKK
jgi:hypothetical protein